MKTTFHFTKQSYIKINFLYLFSIFTVLVLWIVLLPEKGTAQNSNGQVRVIIDNANVRSGAGTNHPVVITLTRGTVLPILDTDGVWYRVRLSSEFGTQDTQGFIHYSAVERTTTIQADTPDVTEPHATSFSPGSDTNQTSNPVSARIGLVPILPSQNALSISFGFPSNSTIYSVEYSHNVSPLLFTGNFIHENIDADDLSGITSFGGRAIYDLTGGMNSLSEAISLFLLGDITYGRWKESVGNESFKLNFLGISAGGGISGTYSLGEESEILLIPYATLALYHMRITGDVSDESESDTEPDFTFGLTLLFDRFYGGLDFQHLLRDSIFDDSSYLTLRFGMLF